jgi:uncharacterized protein YprB with RNaseH-like and TPR domain
MIDKYICLDIETTSLNALYDGQITCICAKSSDGEIFKEFVSKNTDAEFILIMKFLKWINNKGGKLVTISGKGFDVPFIFIRYCLKQSFDLLDLIKDLISREHFDLQDIVEYRVSLNNMAKMYGFDIETDIDRLSLRYSWRW